VICASIVISNCSSKPLNHCIDRPVPGTGTSKIDVSRNTISSFFEFEILNACVVSREFVSDLKVLFETGGVV
jgi:hypothetical protein